MVSIGAIVMFGLMLASSIVMCLTKPEEVSNLTMALVVGILAFMCGVGASEIQRKAKK